MKKYLKISLLGMATALTVGAGCLFLPNTATAEEFTIDLFKSNGATIEAAYDSFNGLKVSARKEGDGILLKDNVAGRFSMEYASLDIAAYCDVKFTFKDVGSKDEVELYLDYSEQDVNAWIVYGEDRVGLYYGGRDVDAYYKGLQGRSKCANASGYYTIVKHEEKHEIVFDPESYSFYLDDVLIWSFVLESNDGASAALMSGFEEYTVEIAFENIDDGNGGMIIKTLNGTSLNNYTYSDWTTNLVVLNNLYAYEGIVYTVPRPYVYNIAEGILDSSNVNVKIFDEDGERIGGGKYAETLSFIPDGASQNYRIEYTYKSTNGKTVKSDVNVSCYTKETVDTNYIFSSEVETKDLGLHAQLLLPTAKLESEIFTQASDDVLIDVYKDGAIYADYKALSAQTQNLIAFNEIGEYVVRYYSPCDYIADCYELVLNVSDKLLAYDHIDIDDVLEIGTKLVVPEINFYYKGETYSASSKVIFPSGECYSNRLIALENPGIYTIRYTAFCDGAEYAIDKNVEALYTARTAFSYDETVNTVGFGSAATTDKIKGVHVITKSNNAEVTYKEKIDLAKLDRNIPLVELFGDAKSLGEEAFTKITIKLTDAYDPSNVVTITCEAKLTEVNGSYIKAGASGQSLLGYWNGSPQITSGFPSLFDFQGETGGADIANATLSIAFDYAERKLYSLNAYNPTVAAVTDYCITDLDDPNLYVKPWTGFSTSECYLSVSVAGMASASASYTIMTIAGKSMAEEFITVKDAPTISLALDEDLPIGRVGVAYPVFAAEATDYYMNTVNVKTCVYYAYGRLNQGELDVVNGKFIPNMEGTYTIVYTATDVFGNSSVKKVNVEIKDENSPITFLLGNGVTEASLGALVQIKAVEALSGGNGTIEQKIDVIAPSGDICDIAEGTFIPMEVGEYLVKYVFTDYLGQTVEDSYIITVAVSDKPILTEELVLPKYFVGGVDYELPVATAASYVGSTTRISPKIYVTDSDGRHLLIDTTYSANVVADGEEILVEYVYIGSNEASTTVSQVVKGVMVKENNKISLDKYFVGEDVTFDKNDSSVIASTDKSNSGFTFIKPLYSDNLMLLFSIAPEQFNAETFKLIVTDMCDEEKSVEFALRLDAATQTLYCSLNGGMEKEMAHILVEGGKEMSFAIGYDALLGLWEDVGGSTFEKATTYVNGKTFTGFSEFVYFEVRFGKVSAATFLNVKQLNNQTFNDLTRDVIAPEIKLGEINTSVSLGDTVTIPSIEAYDVLGYVVSKKVSVQYSYKGNVSFVSDVNGVSMNGADARKDYQITLANYGEYIISYVAEDNAGRQVTVIKNIMIFDDEKPQVTVSGSYNDGYALNDKITIHAMTVKDNLTAEEDLKKAIYVIDANGAMHRVNAGDNYKFILYGKHVVRYFVVDEAGNISIIDYVITIQEASV